MIRAAAITCLLAAEALAIYTLAEWIAASHDHHAGAVPAVLLVLVTLTGFAVVWFAEGWELPASRFAMLVAATAFVAIYGSLRISLADDVAIWDFGWIGEFMDGAEATLRNHPAAIPSAIVLVAAWIRGATRATDDVELEMVPRTLSLPFIAVTVIVVLAAGTDRSGEVARGAAAFYATAVLALACSQLALSDATIGDLRAGGIVSTLLGFTALLTVLSVAVFWVMFGLLGTTIGPVLGRAVEVILTIVLTPPAWLLEQLLRALFANAEFPQITENLRETISETNPDRDERDSGQFVQASRFLLRGLALVIAVAIAAGVIAWFTRLRRRLQSRRDADSTTSAAGSIGEDLRGFAARLLRRRPAEPRPGAASDAERLYFDVLARAERSGEPREPAETPEEYAPRLQRVFRSTVTDDITRAFEAARYGSRPPDSAVVAELEQRWRQSS